MKKTTINLELDNLIKKDGTQSILFRLTKDRKKRRISTGFSVKLDFWNKEKQEVRKNHPNATLINNTLLKKKNDIEKEVLQTDLLNKPLTARELQKKLKKEVVGEDFITFAQRQIDKMPNPSTQGTYQANLNKLKGFSNNTLYFSDITVEFLQNYEAYIKKLGNQTNTIHANLKFVKAIYNDAIDMDVFEPTKNPWRIIKLTTAKSKRVHLTEEQIKMIETFEPTINSNRFRAKNIFLLQYYCLGVRIADMLMMKFVNVHSDRIIFMASKTQVYQKEFSVKLFAKARAIID